MPAVLALLLAFGCAPQGSSPSWPAVQAHAAAVASRPSDADDAPTGQRRAPTSTPLRPAPPAVTSEQVVLQVEGDAYGDGHSGTLVVHASDDSGARSSAGRRHARRVAQATPVELLKKSCGGSSIAIVKAGAQGRRLVVTGLNGTKHDVAHPPEMKRHVARGLACATSKNGSVHGFDVEFGEEPFGCKFCEWRFLIDLKGNVLTHADPPVLIDESRPYGQRQYPNQEDYSRIYRQLELVDEELDYVDPRTTYRAQTSSRSETNNTGQAYGRPGLSAQNAPRRAHAGRTGSPLFLNIDL